MPLARGFQAAALKPADFFGNDDILYLMEDMATGEIRMSILWEWIHKGARLTEDDPGNRDESGDVFTVEIFEKLLEEEYEKLLRADEPGRSRRLEATTLPIVKEIVRAYVADEVKPPWYIDLPEHQSEQSRSADRRGAEPALHGRFQEATAPESPRIWTSYRPPRPIKRGTEMDTFEKEVFETTEWMSSPRFKGITRLYSARQVVEQRGTIQNDYTIARNAAQALYERLRELFAAGRSITTFGPYSPGQAVAMKRIGIEGIYLGGWATSAKGSITEDPGADLASYPLEPGAGRSRAHRAGPAHGRQEPALRPRENERRGAEGHAGDRLPALHHRRRRYRTRG